MKTLSTDTAELDWFRGWLAKQIESGQFHRSLRLESVSAILDTKSANRIINSYIEDDLRLGFQKALSAKRRRASA